MKTENRNMRLIGGYVLYAILAFAPVAVAVGLDWQVYTASAARCCSLSVFGAVTATLVALQAMGHTPKKVKRVVWYALAAASLWLLRPLVDSLALLVTCMAVGEGLATLVAAPLIAKCKRNREKDLMTEAVKEAIEGASGRV